MSFEAIYEFGAFRLDPKECLLFGARGAIRLSAQPCELLRVFVNHPQTILSFDLLKKEVFYGVGTSDTALHVQIRVLRVILGDNPWHPTFIETVKKRGYRFLPRVRRSVAKTNSGDLYEKARHMYHKSASRDLLNAIEKYECIIELNQEYVPDAYAGIAECYVLLGTFGHQILPAPVAMEKARSSAQKAIEMDDRIPEAHAALASVAALYDWDWTIARNHFQTALSLPCNPLAKPMVRSWYALGLAAYGDREGARREIDIAKADFPSSSVLAGLSGRIAYLAGDLEKAIKECDEGIELEEFLFLNYMFKGHALRSLRDWASAAESFERACHFSRDSPVCLAELAHIRGLQGNSLEARRILNQIIEIANGARYVSPHVLAHAHLGLSEFDTVFDLLDKSYTEREAYLVYLTTDPAYDDLRGDPRFEILVKKVGFWKAFVPPTPHC